MPSRLGAGKLGEIEDLRIPGARDVTHPKVYSIRALALLSVFHHRIWTAAMLSGSCVPLLGPQHGGVDRFTHPAFVDRYCPGELKKVSLSTSSILT